MCLLVLCEIVDIFGLYELIVFCVISQKYMVMLCGIFELKYFFGSYVVIDIGGVCFVIVICVLIKQLVGVEDGKKFLLDS